MSDDEALLRLDTVPPPGASGDAYSAPTRVRSRDEILALMEEAGIGAPEGQPASSPPEGAVTPPAFPAAAELLAQATPPPEEVAAPSSSHGKPPSLNTVPVAFVPPDIARQAAPSTPDPGPPPGPPPAALAPPEAAPASFSPAPSSPEIIVAEADFRGAGRYVGFVLIGLAVALTLAIAVAAVISSRG